MHDELNRINHIVSELLLLAKPQQMKFTRANLNKLLQDVLSLLNTEANLNDIQINFTSSLRELWIECEPNQLKQLFINIIKNAMESSQKGGVVSISLDEEENEFVSIKVMDKGCGISKERLDRIGEPFYSSKEKGTGLGLTVSYKIVQSHNGSIHFESEQDVGTNVSINLPIQQPK
jgi:signal transduction histidine kinase